MGLITSGVSPSRDSLEELSSLAMFEPSFLNPGTLSALPEAWSSFAKALLGTLAAIRALSLCPKIQDKRGEAGGVKEGGEGDEVKEALKAAEAVLRCLAERLSRERRGFWDPPLPLWTTSWLPTWPLVPTKTRTALDVELAVARQYLLDATCRLGGRFFASTAIATDPALRSIARVDDTLTMGAFFVLADGLRQPKVNPKTEPKVNPKTELSVDEERSERAEKYHVANHDHKAGKEENGEALRYSGLRVLFQSIEEIEGQLKHISPINLVKQILVSTGPLLLARYHAQGLGAGRTRLPDSVEADEKRCCMEVASSCVLQLSVCCRSLGSFGRNHFWGRISKLGKHRRAW